MIELNGCIGRRANNFNETLPTLARGSSSHSKTRKKMKRNDRKFLDNHVSLIIRTIVSLQVLRQVLWSSSSVVVSAITTDRSNINDYHHYSSLNALLLQQDDICNTIVNSSSVSTSGMIGVSDSRNDHNDYTNQICSSDNNDNQRHNSSIANKRLKTAISSIAASSSVPSTSSSSNINEDDVTSDATTTTKNTCRIYFAESTIPNAGWGLFSGTTYDSDEEVSISGDAVVPLFNMFGRTLLRKLL
jgi:hypothetical protein